MEIRFDEKVVIVTGASLGIGAATAIEFGKAGASVVVNYNTSEEAAKKVVEQIGAHGSEAIAIQADVSKGDDVHKLIKKTVERFGEKIDVLVNNAGSLLARQSLEDMNDELWDQCMDLNIKSVYFCSKAVLPYMKKQGRGHIVNLSSVAGRNGGGIGASHYSCTKGAVITLTKGMSKEFIQHGIIVNSVAPGVINTPFHDRFSTKELRASFRKAIPMDREGEAVEIAYPILFLASEYASYIMGETIEVNGGLLMD